MNSVPKLRDCNTMTKTNLFPASTYITNIGSSDKKIKKKMKVSECVFLLKSTCCLKQTNSSFITISYLRDLVGKDTLFLYSVTDRDTNRDDNFSTVSIKGHKAGLP